MLIKENGLSATASTTTTKGVDWVATGVDVVKSGIGIFTSIFTGQQEAEREATSIKRDVTLAQLQADIEKYKTNALMSADQKAVAIKDAEAKKIQIIMTYTLGGVALFGVLGFGFYLIKRKKGI